MAHALLSLAIVFLLIGPAAAQSSARIPVDVELVLAVDVSGSMSGEELLIQRRGYAQALRSKEVIAAIQSGLLGKVSVIYAEWARYDLRKIIVPWTEIENASDANAFADKLMAANVENMRNTSITGAIDLGVNEIITNEFEGQRRVIDISGDGPNNQGGLVTDARDKAVAQGIVINGLPIMVSPGGGRGQPFVGLDLYYHACVIGGPGAFVLPVNGWDEFAEAVRRKLVLELAGGPAVDLVQPVILERRAEVDCQIGEKMRGSWQSEDYNGGGVNAN